MSFTTLSPSTALAHSVNSSGRMGLYVDSSSCSCSGCADHRLQTLDIPLMDAADAHLFVAPAPLPTRSLGTGISGSAEFLGTVSLRPAPANQIWDGAHWVHTDSEAGRALMGSSSGPTPAVPAARRMPLSFSMGSGWSDVGRAVPAPQPTAQELETDAAMAALRGLRATLQIRQDHVYEGTETSHSDMAIADAEFDDLDRKIMAIEQCMMSFGAIFRTR